MEPKIFFTDLDETLLTREKSMTPATVDAIRRLTDAGHYLAFTSGRPLKSVMEARSLLPITDHHLYYIANNGGLIVDAETGEHIRELRMTYEEVNYLLNTTWAEGIHCHTYTDDQIVTYERTKELTFYQQSIHLPALITDDVLGALKKPPFKCLAITLKGRSHLEALRNKLQPWAEGHIQLVCSTDELLEMFPIASGKGSALEFLAKHLGIPISHTMSAGDQDNDISMLQAAGLGVAMCNGSEGAKAAADVITKSDNNHDGLVPFLNSFFDL